MGDILPFDVLCKIFEVYARFDQPSRPLALETLLLVCRSWFAAATDNQKLWCTFDMGIFSKEALAYWTKCVPMRLARCQSDILLDITINILHQADVPVHAYEPLLSQVTGKSGEYARRWRRLILHVDDREDFMQPYNVLFANFLRFPTPSLEELDCDSLRGHPVLPDTRSLKMFHVPAFVVATLPDLSNVTHLRIGTSSSIRLDIDEVGLARAVNVKTMRITSSRPFKLTGTYKRLECLRIDGAFTEDCLRDFRAPRLRHIGLDVDRGIDYLRLVACNGIAIDALCSAYLSWDLHQFADIRRPWEYRDGLRHFLAHAVNLQVLEIDDRDLAAIVLKILADDCEWLYQSHVLRIIVLGQEIELGRGEYRLASMTWLCGRVNIWLHPSNNWDDILGNVWVHAGWSDADPK